MKRLFGSLTLFGVMLAGGLVASAQDPQQTPPPGGGRGGQGGRMQMPSFADLDKNKDKKLSKEEASQIPPQFFDRLDENKDGFLDEEEYNRRGGRMGGGGGGGPRLSETLGKFLDANQDTKVTREEFARLEQLFDTLDKDHNGELSPEEINRLFEAVREVQNQATGGVEVQGLFATYDKNKDGKITADEMATHEREFKALDLNKDGSITREEADKAVKAIAERANKKKETPPQAPKP
jgi:Ca2+-binding EF-hand superfamily protein